MLLEVYLGFLLTFALHVAAVLTKAKTGRNMLVPLINIKSPLDLSKKMLFYQQVLRSVLSYSAVT